MTGAFYVLNQNCWWSIAEKAPSLFSIKNSLLIMNATMQCNKSIRQFSYVKAQPCPHDVKRPFSALTELGYFRLNVPMQLKATHSTNKQKKKTIFLKTNTFKEEHQNLLNKFYVKIDVQRPFSDWTELIYFRLKFAQLKLVQLMRVSLGISREVGSVCLRWVGRPKKITNYPPPLVRDQNV